MDVICDLITNFDESMNMVKVKANFTANNLITVWNIT